MQRNIVRGEYASVSFDTPLLVMKFLARICEGHFAAGQEFVRIQEEADSHCENVNLLLEVVTLLRMVNAVLPAALEHNDYKLFEFLQSVLDFLAESMLGPCQVCAVADAAWLST